MRLYENRCDYLAAKRGKQDSTFLPLLELDHVSVIRRVILALKRAGISPITVITGEEADQVEKEISGLQTICLYSPRYETLSMFDQICTGLNYMEDLCDSVFILPANIRSFCHRHWRPCCLRTAPASAVLKVTGPSDPAPEELFQNTDIHGETDCAVHCANRLSPPAQQKFPSAIPASFIRRHRRFRY
mgnify:CR=1 FL=1